jgi:hypothetical protein
MTDIDWSPFDSFSESTVTCVNDHEYRSHAKIVFGPKNAAELVARKPCPTCGTIALRKASSDPESFTISK